MKCPRCGYPRLSYKVSRHKNWRGRAGDARRQDTAYEPRLNFETNPCSKCGWKGEIVEHWEVSSE